MRTKQETERAAAILQKKGDRISLVQLGIVVNGRTESWVFEHYVQNISEEAKDEATFFAARDAARYVAGSIALEELIPDAEAYAICLSDCGDSEAGTLLVGVDILYKLVKQIARLEQKIDALTSQRAKDIPYTTQADYSKDDFMTQEKAYQYIGCSKVTLQSWTKRGLVKASRKGSHVYYSKSELDENVTVQNFKHLKTV